MYPVYSAIQRRTLLHFHLAGYQTPAIRMISSSLRGTYNILNHCVCCCVFFVCVFVCVCVCVCVGGGGGGGGGGLHSVSREIYPGFCFALFRCVFIIVFTWLIYLFHIQYVCSLALGHSYGSGAPASNERRIWGHHQTAKDTVRMVGTNFWHIFILSFSLHHNRGNTIEMITDNEIAHRFRMWIHRIHKI